jgi:hypothetical protein
LFYKGEKWANIQEIHIYAISSFDMKGSLIYQEPSNSFIIRTRPKFLITKALCPLGILLRNSTGWCGPLRHYVLIFFLMELKALAF